MGIININSIKWFNETTNGTDFTQNLTKYTDVYTGNVGEKVKMLMEVDYSNVYRLSPSINTLEVKTDGLGDTLTLTGSYLDTEGFRVGDIIEVYDNKTNQIKAEAQILSFDVIGFFAVVSITGIWKVGIYDDCEIRLLTELKHFKAKIRPFAFANDGGSVEYSPFNVPLEYKNDLPVGDGGPRSTSFVDFVARNPNNWDSGAMRMRYVSDPELYYQRFEVEYEFIITPYHLEGNTYNPLTLPDEFKDGSLQFRFELSNLEPEFVSERLTAFKLEAGNIGWFNENFSGKATNYAVDSIAYYDLTDAVDIDKINALNDTRVTVVITGDKFTALEPVVAYHSKAPTEQDYQNNNFNYNEIWVNDVLSNDIGAVSNSSTIIKNLSINLDSATQITVQFDLEYTGAEQIINGADYLLWLAVEDSTIIAPLDSNRTSLLLDFNQYVASSDEFDGFILDSYTMYNHVSELDVDTPTTDYEGYIEDGVLLELTYRIKSNPDSSGDEGNWEDNLGIGALTMVAYNTATDTLFKLTPYYNMRWSRQSKKTGSDWFYMDKGRNDWGYQKFNLANDDQFNRGHLSAPTIDTDISYISNDGTYSTYKALIGMKIHWQEFLQLNQNFSGGRVTDNLIENYTVDFLGGAEFGLQEVKNTALFGDSSQAHGGYNKILSKYKDSDWIIRPLMITQRDNTIAGTGFTEFWDFMPEWKVYNYDSNSTYTGTTQTFDSDDNDLDGDLLNGEDTKIVITLDDLDVKTDILDFNGIIRIANKRITSWDIHELSTFRDTYDGNLLKGFGTGGLLVEKSIVNDKYTMTCLVDGTLLNPDLEYRITGRFFDTEIPFNPVTDATLSAWYDASGLLTNTDNSYGTVSALDEVSVWKDLKGTSALNLIQPTLANQPIFDSINTKVDFDGLSEYLYWFDNDLNSEWSIFVVVEMSNAGTTDLINVRRGDLSNNPQFTNDINMFCGADGGNPQGRIEAWDSSSAFENITETPTTTTDGDKAIMQFSMNYSGDWYLKVDDVRHDTPVDVMGAYNIPALNSLFVGAYGLKFFGSPSVNSYITSKFHEIMIFANQDVSAKETKVHDYLKAKWSI